MAPRQEESAIIYSPRKSLTRDNSYVDFQGSENVSTIMPDDSADIKLCMASVLQKKFFS